MLASRHSVFDELILTDSICLKNKLCKSTFFFCFEKVRLPKVVHKLKVKISKHFKLKQLGLIDVFMDGIWEVTFFHC
jgi:hypothetical protein